MTIEKILRGALHGWDVYDRLEDPKVAWAGGDWVDTTFHQILLLYGTMGTLCELAGTFDRAIPLPVRVGVSALPVLLWQAHRHTVEHPNSHLERAIDLIHGHLGEACLAVAVCSGASLVYMGERVMGSIALGLTLFGPVEKKIPHAIRKRIRLLAQFLALGAAIRYGDRLEKGTAVATGALLLQMWLPRRSPPKIETVEVVVDQPDDQLKGRCQVNRAHVYAYEPEKIPTPPDVKLDDFLSLFNSIDPSEAILKGIVEDDDEWNKAPSTRGTPKDFARAGLEKFVNSLKNQAVEAGDLEDFDPEIAKAKHILKALQNRDPSTQTRYLAKLGVWAGHHCATAYMREIGSAYRSLCYLPPDDLGQQVSDLLAQRRALIFDKVIQTRHDELPWWLQHIFDPKWDHNKNQFIQLFGAHVGHPLATQAMADIHALGHLEQKVILQALYLNVFPFFWRKYDEATLIKAVREGMTIKDPDQLPPITNSKIEDWLRSYYKGEDFDSWKQQAYDEDYILEDQYIKLMLIHYGFLMPAEDSKKSE